MKEKSKKSFTETDVTDAEGNITEIYTTIEAEFVNGRMVE